MNTADLINRSNHDLESEYLESILSEDIECESAHGFGEVKCSVEVTHLSLGSCDGSVLHVCTNAAVWALSRILGPGSCDGCLRPTAMCWSIRAI